MSEPLLTPGTVEQGSHHLVASRWVIDVVRYQPTKRPIEDRWSYAHDEPSSRLVVGVYDGHGGSSCAEHISKVLPQALLAQLPSQHLAVFEDTDARLMKKFTDDHSLLRPKSKNWVSHAKIAKSGCMAIVCDLDLQTMTATISNAGDCRLAVIRGSSSDSSEEPYTIVQETADLNARVAAERERIAKEHPGEDMIVVSGRLFGRLMSTRGFGDIYYKLPCGGPLGKFNHKRYIDAMSAVEDPGKVRMSEQYESYFYGYRSPPYITPSPESYTVAVKAGDIIILASDGLWDRVSTQEAAAALWDAACARAPNLAGSILQSVLDKQAPGDDTTIVVLHFVGDEGQQEHALQGEFTGQSGGNQNNGEPQ